jgi:signal transduction histidine kinase
MSTGSTPDSFLEEERYRGISETFLAESYLSLIGQLVRNLDLAERARADAEAERVILAERHAFVSTLSHQLRTPVASLRWGLPMLVDQRCDPALARGLMEKTENLADLVDKLIFYSEIQGNYLVTKPVPVSLNELVHDALAESRRRAEFRAVTVQWEPLSQADSVIGDRAGLARAIYFLIDNAISYSHEGGQVNLSLAKNGSHLALTIEDHGIGIPAAEQGRVFDRFYRATNASLRKNEGSGIGLHMARLVAKAHGGRLDFTSVEGKGTTFILELPA